MKLYILMVELHTGRDHLYGVYSSFEKAEKELTESGYKTAWIVERNLDE